LWNFTKTSRNLCSWVASLGNFSQSGQKIHHHTHTAISGSNCGARAELGVKLFERERRLKPNYTDVKRQKTGCPIFLKKSFYIQTEQLRKTRSISNAYSGVLRWAYRKPCQHFGCPISCRGCTRDMPKPRCRNDGCHANLTNKIKRTEPWI